MFKSLRDRLKGVSKKLEDEVEKQLGDQLERELEAELNKGKAPTPPASPAPTPAPAPVTPPAPAAATSPPPPAPIAPAPTHATSMLPDKQSPTEPSPQHPTHTPVSPKPGDLITSPLPPAEMAPEGARATTRPPPPPSPVVPHPEPPVPHEHRKPPAPAPPPSASPTPAPPTARPPVAAAPQQAVQPAPVPPAAARNEPKPQPAVTGRKQLTDAEIEERLARELSEAVAVQKEVEQVVKTVAPAATRFTINEQVLEDILWDLEVGLLESDVALPVIEAIKANVKEQLLSLAVGGGKPEEIVEKVLRSAIKRVLQVNPLDFDAFIRDRMAKGRKPVVVMFVGVNGTGKTTSIGRLAYRLKEQGISCCMAAGDTFRAGAIEQLALHGERLGVTVIKHKANADPAAVAFDAIEHAKARHKDVVLLDTAGRMQNNSNLMDEMDKIRRVANPDLVVFVGDSLAGNDAVEQARKFDEVVDIGGVILTKVDVDAKGGAALSVAYTINKPLLFVGVGQNYPDLKPFDAGWMVDRLFGSEADEEAAVAA